MPIGMIEIIDQSDKEIKAWSDFVKSSSAATIAHQIGWKQVMVDGLNHRPKYLMALKDSEVTGILPMVIMKTWWQRKYLISIPWIDYGGIIAHDSESEELLLDAAIQTAKSEKVDFLELRSVLGAGRNLPTRKDKVTFLLNLNHDPEIIWKGFDAKLRNQIRKAEKSGLAVEFGGKELFDSFYKVFAHNMRDLGTPVWGKKFFAAILTVFSESAQIVLVRKSDEVIGAGLVLSFKDRLYVPSASSYRSAIKDCPNHALYWAIIKKGCELGYSFFDFGRSTWNSNTYNFKKQWVSEPTQLTWQYYLERSKEIPALNPANPKYDYLIKIWKRIPLPIANILGPKIIRNFP